METARLTIRRLRPSDAGFIRELLNDPEFIRYIGDRGVRTDADASSYISNGPMASYARHGFGLYLVGRKSDGAPAGICGLLQRDYLPDVDLGFAFLPAFRSQGLAFEAATAILAEARSLGRARVLAITSPDNTASIRLLGKLGFRFERCVRPAGERAQLSIFAREDPPENRAC